MIVDAGSDGKEFVDACSTVSMRQHTSAYDNKADDKDLCSTVSIRQHTSSYDNIADCTEVVEACSTVARMPRHDTLTVLSYYYLRA
jgi:hypothetical protein